MSEEPAGYGWDLFQVRLSGRVLQKVRELAAARGETPAAWLEREIDCLVSGHLAGLRGRPDEVRPRSDGD